MAFSQPPEGKFIHWRLESIVPLLFWKKKNRLTFYLHDYTSEWFKRGGFRLLFDKASHQKTGTLREMEVWANRIRFFFPDISCSDFCFSCQLGESYLIRKLSYLGRCSTMLESCSLCIKWYSKVELLLSSVLGFTGALVNKLGVTDFFLRL